MDRSRFISLLATAFVLYAGTSLAAHGPLSLLSWIGLALAGALAALPWIARRERAATDLLLSSVACEASVLLVTIVAYRGLPLLSEALRALLLPLFAMQLLVLACESPDTPPRLSRYVRLVRLISYPAALCAGVGLVAALPPIAIGGRALVLSATAANAPVLSAFVIALGALALRLFRARLGSDARALSENGWPTLALVLALPLASFAVLASHLSARLDELSVLAAGLALLSAALGHRTLGRLREVHAVGPQVRALLADAVAVLIALLAAGAWLLATSDPLSRLAALLFGQLVAFAAARVLRPWIDRKWAPASGLLLAALREIETDAARSLTLDELAASVLRPLRRATLSPEACPLFYALHPPREIRLDAAGQPRGLARGAPRAIEQHFRDKGARPILRDDLAARLVRRPELRELVETLDALDTLVAVPLLVEAELEGMILVPRGARTTRISFEEWVALERMAEQVASTVAVLGARERALLREADAEARAAQLLADKVDLSEELAALRERLTRVEVCANAPARGAALVAYSAPMRALDARLSELSAQELPVLLVAEPGIPLVPLAAKLHETRGRTTPLLVIDLAAHDPETITAQLLGEGPSAPGWLELAEGGTLVLLEAPCLPEAAQTALAGVCAERRYRPLGQAADRAAQVRLVLSSRIMPSELAPTTFSAPLLAWLEPGLCRVPPLRECRQDLESLTMIAAARAARALGQEAKGVDAELLETLLAHDFPNNHEELALVMAHAVRHATGSRIAVGDLPPLARSRPLSGSFVDQEREILRRALDRAAGNRTKAARVLGLSRARFIEKLRKHGLDDTHH